MNLRDADANEVRGLGFLFNRIVAVLVSACLVLSLSAPPALARQGCMGCNVVDDGLLTPALIGRQLYYRADGKKILVTVIDVDTNARQLEWRTSDYRTGWSYASNFYTPSRSQERDTAIVGGTAAGVILFACLLGMCSNNSSSNQSSSNSYERREDCRRQCRRNTDYNDNRSIAAGDDCLKRCDR
ncbi:hypothetical protein DMC25_05490 [Caulobacter sp. D4A]|nr:hypothetical protein DMC25_05490 [Caulobacter sp. D4A]